MINHVVLFKMNDFPSAKKAAILAELKLLLEGLEDKISELKYIEVGLNHETDAKSFDLALISHFESLEDLEKYKIHPEHVKVAERINAVMTARATVDYVF